MIVHARVMLENDLIKYKPWTCFIHDVCKLTFSDVFYCKTSTKILFCIPYQIWIFICVLGVYWNWFTGLLNLIYTNQIELNQFVVIWYFCVLKVFFKFHQQKKPKKNSNQHFYCQLNSQFYKQTVKIVYIFKWWWWWNYLYYQHY